MAREQDMKQTRKKHGAAFNSPLLKSLFDQPGSAVTATSRNKVVGWGDDEEDRHGLPGVNEEQID